MTKELTAKSAMELIQGLHAKNPKMVLDKEDVARKLAFILEHPDHAAEGLQLFYDIARTNNNRLIDSIDNVTRKVGVRIAALEAVGDVGRAFPQTTGAAIELLTKLAREGKSQNTVYGAAGWLSFYALYCPAHSVAAVKALTELSRLKNESFVQNYIVSSIEKAGLGQPAATVQARESLFELRRARQYSLSPSVANITFGAFEKALTAAIEANQPALNVLTLQKQGFHWIIKTDEKTLAAILAAAPIVKAAEDTCDYEQLARNKEKADLDQLVTAEKTTRKALLDTEEKAIAEPGKADWETGINHRRNAALKARTDLETYAKAKNIELRPAYELSICGLRPLGDIEDTLTALKALWENPRFSLAYDFYSPASMMLQQPNNDWVMQRMLTTLRQTADADPKQDAKVAGFLGKLADLTLLPAQLATVLEMTFELAMKNGGELAAKAVETLSTHIGFGKLPASGNTTLFHIAEIGRAFPHCENKTLEVLLKQTRNANLHEEACGEVSKSYTALRAAFETAQKEPQVQSAAPAPAQKNASAPKI